MTDAAERPSASYAIKEKILSMNYNHFGVYDIDRADAQEFIGYRVEVTVTGFLYRMGDLTSNFSFQRQREAILS